MGWKIVRDRNEAWSRAHGVSGTWRTSTNPMRGLARKLVEESAEHFEQLDPAELYDLRDVLEEQIRLADPAGRHEEAHRDKIAKFGMFTKHVEWSPVPGDTSQDPIV